MAQTYKDQGWFGEGAVVFADSSSVYHLGALVKSASLEQLVETSQFRTSDSHMQRGRTDVIGYRIRMDAEIVDPELEAKILGGSLEVGSKRLEFMEKGTIASDDITLTNGGGSGEAVIKILKVIGSNGKEYKQVAASSEVADESFSLSGAVLTFNGSDTSTFAYVTYAWSSTTGASATGQKLEIPVPKITDDPVQWTVFLSNRIINKRTGAHVTNEVIEATHCYLQNGFTQPIGFKESGSVELEFEVALDSAGQLVKHYGDTQIPVLKDAAS